MLTRMGEGLVRARVRPRVLGPVPLDPSTVRALVSVPRASGAALARAVHEAQSARTTKKLPGNVRVRVDPATLT